MVSLLVATTADPASIGPASALLALSPATWAAGPSLHPESVSFVSGRVRLLQLNGRLVTEDHLDKRWEAGTGERVEEIIFLSRHVAASSRPALTLHPIGVPHLLPHETPPAGGRPGWAAPPCPRIAPWFRLLKNVASKQNLVPEFEVIELSFVYIYATLSRMDIFLEEYFYRLELQLVTLEATHHGPEVNSPAMFFEIGSTEDYWGRKDAAQAVATVLQEGLGLDGGPGVGQWSSANKGEKVLVGLGGGHYAPRHMDVVQKEGVWVGHLLSNYSLPMEEPGVPIKPTPNQKGNLDAIYSQIGGSWKESITEAVMTTRSAFPDAEVMAHLDSKWSASTCGTLPEALHIDDHPVHVEWFTEFKQLVSDGRTETQGIVVSAVKIEFKDIDVFEQ